MFRSEHQGMRLCTALLTLSVPALFGACEAAPKDGSIAQREERPASNPVDSAEAVRIAIETFRTLHADYPMKVYEFQRDGDTYLITLVRTDPVLGGGGLVKVNRDGTASIEWLGQ